MEWKFCCKNLVVAEILLLQNVSRSLENATICQHKFSFLSTLVDCCIFLQKLIKVSATTVAFSKVSATSFRVSATKKSQYSCGSHSFCCIIYILLS